MKNTVLCDPEYASGKGVKNTHPHVSADMFPQKSMCIMPLYKASLSGALEELRSAGYHFSHHIHSSIEIYRILSGDCYLDIRSQTVHCTEGDFMMLLPDVMHSFYLNDKSDCSFQHIHFDPELFAGIVLENNGIQPVTLLHAILFNSRSYYYFRSDCIIDNTINKLISLYASSNSLFSAANINVSLIQLMLYILDKSEPPHSLTAPQRQNSYVAYTLNYIKEHYAKKIIQEDIANQLHISTRYLSKLFKSYMGLSFPHYINIYRINRSIELMPNHNLSLTDIALSVGFNDSQHYSKVFMKVVNASPSQYRKLIQK